MDAEKREKVIRGLECCISDDLLMACLECPYGRERDYRTECIRPLLRDVLSLLREQEPRVMTWDEVLEFAEFSDAGYSEKTPCYIEYFEPDPCFIKWADAETIYKWVNFYITRNERRRLYNRNNRHGWRCWTSRPSKQQMQDTKWEEMP